MRVDGNRFRRARLATFLKVLDGLPPGKPVRKPKVRQESITHAPCYCGLIGRGVVRVDSLTLPYWNTRFIGAKRVS